MKTSACLFSFFAHAPLALFTAAAIAISSIVPNPDCLGAESVPQIRLERLSRGINASHWFAQVYAPEGYSPKHFRTFIAERDAAFLEHSGLRHVRLSVEPEGLFNPQNPAVLNQDRLQELDRAIEMLLSHRLAVIVDVHTFGEFLDKLSDDDAHLAAVAAFWEALASHMTKYDPDWVYLELLNEPQVHDAARWQKIMETLAAAARRGAPEHTIIVSGKSWSSLADLLLLNPLQDRNVVYNFHFYEPGIFTHQGATWAYPPWEKVRNAPYPVDPERLKASGAKALDEESGKLLAQYAEERWNAEKIDSMIAKAAEWGRSRGVPLTCNEFGVYASFSDPQSRLNYLSDVRKALEKHGIGWSMWDYAGGFHLVKPRVEGEAIRFDAGVPEALGLR